MKGRINIWVLKLLPDCDLEADPMANLQDEWYSNHDHVSPLQTIICHIPIHWRRCFSTENYIGYSPATLGDFIATCFTKIQTVFEQKSTEIRICKIPRHNVNLAFFNSYISVT